MQNVTVRQNLKLNNGKNVFELGQRNVLCVRNMRHYSIKRNLYQK